MARVFVPNAAGAWDALALDAARYQLADANPPAIATDDAERALREGALLVRANRVDGPAEPDGETWVALAGDRARLRINGEPLALGIAVLRHRDELRLGGDAPFYFSTERPAEVQVYPHDDAPRCPRCAQAIGRDEPCVRCPGCGVRHHQREDRPCWTYAPSCALCDQPTELDAGLRWTPEVL